MRHAQPGCRCRHCRLAALALAATLQYQQRRAHYAAQDAQLAELAGEHERLRRQLAATTEQERRRLAGMLHDGPMQDAGEAVRLLREAESDLAAVPGRGRAARIHLQAALARGEQLLAELRGVMEALYPATPPRTPGVAPPLESWCQAICASAGLRCRIQIEPALLLSDAGAAQEGLFAIAREALRNTARHARASVFQLALVRDDADLLLTIADDGIGFQPSPIEALRAAGRFGLALLHEQARQLGGTAAIQSAPGAGTHIQVRIPLQPYGPRTRRGSEA